MRKRAALIILTLAVLVPAMAGDGEREETAAHAEIAVPPAEIHKEVPVPPPERPVRRSDQPTSTRAVVMRGLHSSIQVNVDGLGDNIVGDAANEPSIAIDPTDPSRIVIGWRQFDSIALDFRQAGYAYSHDGGATWTFPGALQPGQFRSDPVLAADSQGNIFYYSLSSVTTAEMFISPDQGLTWDGPIPALGGDKIWMAIDTTGGIGNDNVYALWNSQFTCCAAGTDITRSTDGGQTYEGPFVMTQHPKWGTLDVGPDGTLFVTGATLFGDSHLVLRSSNARDPAATPTFDLIESVDMGGITGGSGGPNPGGLLGQVWIAVDRSAGATSGNVYVLGSISPGGSDPLDVHFIRSEDGGQTWTAPLRVNAVTDGYQWFATMSVSPQGRIDVVWNDTRNDSGTISELYYAYSTDAGDSWSAGLPVSPPFDPSLGYPQQNKIGDYYHMVSDAAGAGLAYSATFNGEQDVYFLRVGDCNANGTHDAEDIATLTSEDCDSNGIPDECETDCNGNGIADECDVADGTSDDCNTNAIPDECEADCNGNGIADGCDVIAGTSDDCNANAVPDECDLAGGQAHDCNLDGQIDECGVSDDLESGAGWSVGSGDDTATLGIWTRVDPIGTEAQPEDDHSPDPGVNCFVTGQGKITGGLGDFDVDGGKTTLFSPLLDLGDMIDPRLGYWRWYSNDKGASPNEDVFIIDISNDGGGTWTNVETVGPTGPEASGGWFHHVFRVADHLPPTSSVMLRFVAADEGSGSVVEAAIDDLVVVDCRQCSLDPDCDDGDPCTLDSCDALLGQCGNAAPPVPGEADRLVLVAAGGGVADLGWDAEPGAESYDVYRGGQRDASDLACYESGLAAPALSDDGLMPPPGDLLLYVVGAANCSGKSPLGSGRTAAVPCP